jgi:adenylosuccinate synthase
MRILFAISGPIAVGKSSITRALVGRHGGLRLSTRQAVIAATGSPDERGALQAAGEDLDRKTDGRWVADEVERLQDRAPADGILIVDSVRTARQIEHLRERFPGKIIHVHLVAPEAVLAKRYLERPPEIREFATYDEVRASPTEAAVASLEAIADRVVDTDRHSPESGVASVMRGLGFHAPTIERLVDVIVGAQYGSEGKGNICAHLAGDYDVLMRVGGPNAGHMVAKPRYKYVQLPSGTGSNPRAKILIGAGATIWVPTLLREMQDRSLGPDRLAIDPQAMIIHQSDRDLEGATLGAIASTKQGVGAATARKVIGRDLHPHLGARVQLAREVPEFKGYLRDTKVELERAYAAGHHIMLEGTQGTDLSLHHGKYPHVTSRETTASGCLADAGIAPLRVRRVVMVTRTYPIRVGSSAEGESGDLPNEIDLQTIADRSRIPVEEIIRTEVGTVSGRQRRVGEFNLEQVRRSAALNGATDLALTFADYLDLENRKAKSFDDLTPKTRDFIAELEAVTRTPVTLVSTWFDATAQVLDRRTWR